MPESGSDAGDHESASCDVLDVKCCGSLTTEGGTGGLPAPYTMVRFLVDVVASPAPLTALTFTITCWSFVIGRLTIVAEVPFATVHGHSFSSLSVNPTAKE